jgi:hypothetical protein
MNSGRLAKTLIGTCKTQELNRFSHGRLRAQQCGAHSRAPRDHGTQSEAEKPFRAAFVSHGSHTGTANEVYDIHRCSLSDSDVTVILSVKVANGIMPPHWKYR